VLSSRRKKIIWIVIGCAVACLVCLVGLLVSLWLKQPKNIVASVRGPMRVRKGETFLLKIEVENTGQKSQTLHSIQVSMGYLEGIEIEKTEPPFIDSSTFSAPGPDYQTYTFDQTIKPGGRVLVQLTAVGIETGDFSGDTHVCINDGFTCVIIYPHTTVLEAPAPTAAPTSTPTSTPTDTPTAMPVRPPADIRLNADGSGDYPTLEKALAAASSGETILLEAGTYSLAQSLEVDKPLTLLGAGMDQTEIVSEAGGYVIRFSGGGPFIAQDITFRHEGDAVASVAVVDAGDIAFARCRFTGAVYTEEAGDLAGLWLQGNTTGTVQECEAVENDSFGILVDDQAEPTLEGNSCTDNELFGIAYSGEAGGAARHNTCLGSQGGIGVAGHAEPTLEKNVCTDNELGGILYGDHSSGVACQNECSGNGIGIIVNDRAQPTLEGNVCADNDKSGISYYGTVGGLARDNDCSRNEGAGIEIANQAQPTLEENTCTDNEQGGIGYADSASGLARGNVCSGNRLFGIGIVQQAEPTLEGNTCNDNELAGIAYSYNTGGVARQNECAGNGRYGIGILGQAEPTLEGNVCTNNLDAGIAYFDDASGVARQNECAQNALGFFIAETADPELVDNNCHDNVEEDVRDLRP
jgi:parallel beta-helix repeat protein